MDDPVETSPFRAVASVIALVKPGQEVLLETLVPVALPVARRPLFRRKSVHFIRRQLLTLANGRVRTIV